MKPEDILMAILFTPVMFCVLVFGWLFIHIAWIEWKEKYQ
jgi:hypothetical protein